MRRWFWIATVAALAGCASGSARADTLFGYRGHLLRAVSGNGVPDVQHLQFTLSGRKPDRGTCSADVRIVSVSDGNLSLQALLKYHFRIAADSHVAVCRDGTSGALNESLYLHLELRDGGVLQAAYSWTSRDPRKGGPADSVTEFNNVEYHVSSAAKTGRLVTIRAGS